MIGVLAGSVYVTLYFRKHRVEERQTEAYVKERADKAANHER